MPNRAPQPRSWLEMRRQIEERLAQETGQDVAAWSARIREHGFAGEPDLRRWLDAEGVHGYPQMFLVYETFGYPDYLEKGGDQLIDEQYADRPNLRPIYDAIVGRLPDVGQVELQARKGYVALLTPRRTFASIQATTRSRIDVGLRLDGVLAAGRLQPGKGIGQSSMTHKVALSSSDDVDDELVALLRRAYDASA